MVDLRHEESVFICFLRRLGTSTIWPDLMGPKRLKYDTNTVFGVKMHT